LSDPQCWPSHLELSKPELAAEVYYVHVCVHSGFPSELRIWIGWLDLLAVQGTLSSLLQQHSLKVSIFWLPLSLWSNSYIHT